MNDKKEIKCFGHTLYKFKCQKSIYSNNNLNNAIQDLFKSDYAQRHNVEEGHGELLTTCGKEKNILDYSNETQELTNWIKNQIISIDKYNHLNRRNIQFTRNWVNQMLTGSSGEVHTHHHSFGDAVALFYLKNSENGSKLVIVKEPKKYNNNYLEYNSNDLHFIDTETGDLVIHDINVTHAVSEHKGNEPRICLIFEFKVVT